jgi:hypothetical protein
MTKALINIVNGYSAQLEPKIDAQRTINMYVISSPGGKVEKCLAPMPGIKLAAVINNFGTNTRQTFSFEDNMYVVCNNKIYSVDKTLAVSLLGTIGTSSGYVGITANSARQIIFIDGDKGYLYDLPTTTFSQITAAGFPDKPETVTFLDGYFIITVNASNKFHISGLNDGNTWDALKFAEFVSKPNNIIASAILHRRLFLFGTTGTEIWYDAGGTDFPLSRDNNLLLEYGCAARGSVAVGYQKLFWLAGDENGVGSVMMTDGTQPMPISTPEVDYVIQKYSNPSDAVSLIYKINGHIFYELSFQQDNHTWIYDATANLWHEGSTLSGDRKIASCHTFFNNKHYIGSRNSAKIYELSASYYDDDGEAILRERICGHFADPHMRLIRITRFNLDVIPGIANIINSEYEDPTIWLSFSKDGGKTYSNEIPQSMGRIGERLKRIIWRRLGVARDWIFRIRFYGKNPFYILNASIDYEVTGR